MWNLQKAFSLRTIKVCRFEIIDGVKYVYCMKHAYKSLLREQVGLFRCFFSFLVCVWTLVRDGFKKIDTQKCPTTMSMQFIGGTSGTAIVTTSLAEGKMQIDQIQCKWSKTWFTIFMTILFFFKDLLIHGQTKWW